MYLSIQHSPTSEREFLYGNSTASSVCPSDISNVSYEDVNAAMNCLHRASHDRISLFDQPAHVNLIEHTKCRVLAVYCVSKQPQLDTHISVSHGLSPNTGPV